MTDQLLRDKIKQLKFDGLPIKSIAEALNTTIEIVRYHLGVTVHTDGETPREELPPAKPGPSSDMAAAALANRQLAATTGRHRGEFAGPGYETAPGGGKLRDGSPAPKSFTDPAYRRSKKGRGGMGI